jgi:hypothetical protein
MTRNGIIAIAKRLGFKPWGNLRKYHGSSYQCFRRKNHYAWIGYRYIEIDTQMVACDFVGEKDKDVIAYCELAIHHMDAE